ncbi:hypothetical protein OVA21_17890 [Dietzia sp. SL131]|uniref:hypothetical protein n=1 Tax=Dietzia sp. SL131 TaxID=2995149 RepID=UPI00227C3DB8|nr:hypothetical protein [Dietzia sp. SL131]MCY1659036.1 hypothetical protein [Dietzia sp. SL131]
MVRRRPASMIAALCAAVVLAGAPMASAQLPGPAGRAVVTDLPVLSELPPLPSRGAPADVDEQEVDDTSGMSGVQIIALTLAGAALVAGGTGLALVTRRGRGDLPGEQPARTGPPA